jgi:HD superfamily phosphohydrolase
MATTIKDTIHGYIDLDAFEERVVDSPWFQRMRRVRQNDVGSYVFPTMQTTRFEHSLGAMHLAGQCLSSALDDSTTQPNVGLFLNQLGAELAGLKYEVPASNLRAFAVRCVRMYGALHDVGHPPYSHLIEGCYSPADIGVAGGVSDHWHETNGATIVEQFLPAHLGVQGEEAAVLGVVAHLAKKGSKPPALAALKELVDSVIDVDRMDFVLRDGRNSGSEFGRYDVQRLVGSFRVHVDEIKAGVPQSILIRPLHKALSSIESLIQERYKIYRWVLFHHRVMQSRALMRFVMQQTRSDPNFDPHQFQAANYVPQLSNPQAGVKANYVLLGDGVVDQHLDRHLRALEAKSGSLTYDETRLKTALGILILRKDLGVSLWKRTDTYSNERDASSFETFLRNAFTAGSPSPPHRELTKIHGSYANWVASVLARSGSGGIQDRIVDTLNEKKDANEWYLLEAPRFKASGDDRVLVQDAEGKLRPEHLSDVSTVARATEEARAGDVHMFAFRFTTTPPVAADVERIKRDGREKLATAIASLYRSSATIRDLFAPNKK